MSTSRQKFATQVNTETLARVREIAAREGRQIQVLVDEALADLVEKRRQGRARPHVMAAYRRSRKKYDELYRKLAQ
ncbi:MAG: hypothetical protein F4Y20_02170 [Acidobacteria bacterium]|nr:hypothetical protein [Acidobacteriota bacterium]MYH21240.1 hypothetical protein [Acidobacteriota bacterium]